MTQPQFVIAKRLNTLSYYINGDLRAADSLKFSAGPGPDERLYLKPEEVGRVVVSDPFEFEASPTSLGYNWRHSETMVKFFDCFKSIVQPTVIGMEEDRRHRLMRLVLCGLSEAPIFPPGTDSLDVDHPDFFTLVKVPMKLKLISNYHHSHSKADKEKCYITELAKCFGQQDFSLVLEESGDSGAQDITLPNSVELMWNPEDLVWEADTELQFSKLHGSLENFGGDLLAYETRFPRILVKLKDAAVSTVLSKHFGFFGNNQHARRTLEEEICTDLVIKDRYGNPVKCHRFPLIIASAQFGNMLNDTRDWKEASTRTINLDLSKETILAMLHFIYYGGNNRIVSGSVTQAMELLQLGHMYELQNLVELTSFVLVLKGECFTFDEGWELYRYSERMLKLEQNSRWRELKRKGIWVLTNYRDCYENSERMKASELYQKLLSIAESLGPAFVGFLDEPFINDGAKMLPINLKDVSMEDCKLLFDYLFATNEYYEIMSLFDVSFDAALALLVLAEHTLCDSWIFPWIPDTIMEESGILSKPSTWFEVDHLVALFTLSWRCGWKTSGIANKLQWFVANRNDQVLASTKYQEMFKNNWKCAMEFTSLCLQDDS